MRQARTLSLYLRLRGQFGPQTILRSPAVRLWRWVVGTERAGRYQQQQPFAAKESQMSFILWLIVGGIVGWLASLIMKTDGQQGILLNVIVGIVGAFIGGWLISPMLGTGTINDGFSIGSVVVSLIGAIILLAIVNLFRRGRVR
jgi:uncharacterized membrane protein YeaQ/YmgE (transglycosylase-associated protein family)